jgi:hypothetical protein
MELMENLLPCLSCLSSCIHTIGRMRAGLESKAFMFFDSQFRFSRAKRKRLSRFLSTAFIYAGNFRRFAGISGAEARSRKPGCSQRIFGLILSAKKSYDGLAENRRPRRSRFTLTPAAEFLLLILLVSNQAPIVHPRISSARRTTTLASNQNVQ